MYLNQVEALLSKYVYQSFKILPSTLNTEKFAQWSFMQDMSNKEKLWDYAKEIFHWMESEEA